MKPFFKKTTLHIKEKLESLKNSSILTDPFNYKKKVQVNLIRFLMLEAKARNRGIQALSITLRLSELKPVGYLTVDKKRETLRSRQICQLFTGEEKLNSYVLLKIKKALIKLSNKEGIAMENIGVNLRIQNCQARLRLCDSTESIKELSIGELVGIL